MEYTKRQERKNQDILSTSGYGLLVLTLWAVIKTLLFLNNAPDIMVSLLDDYFGINYSSNYFDISIYVLGGIEFLIKVFVGYSAIKVGKTLNVKKIAYLICAFILMIVYLVYIAYDILLIIKMIDAVSIISFLIDAFNMYIIYSIIISSVKLKKSYTLNKI